MAITTTPSGAIAGAGDGTLAFLENPGQLADLYASELQGLATTIGRRVSIGIRPQNGAELVDVLNDLTTTSAGGGFWESFMGTDGNVKISEIASTSVIYREAGFDGMPGSNKAKWEDLVKRGYLKRKAAAPPPVSDSGAVKAYQSAAPEAYELPGDINKPAHQPHLENFFAAVRGQAKLNCDARHAFESEAPIFWVNPSALSRQPIEFKSEHLSV